MSRPRQPSAAPPHALTERTIGPYTCTTGRLALTASYMSPIASSAAPDTGRVFREHPEPAACSPFSFDPRLNAANVPAAMGRVGRTFAIRPRGARTWICPGPAPGLGAGCGPSV